MSDNDNGLQLGAALFTQGNAKLVGFYTINGPTGLIEAPTIEEAEWFIDALWLEWPNMMRGKVKINNAGKAIVPVWSNPKKSDT